MLKIMLFLLFLVSSIQVSGAKEIRSCREVKAISQYNVEAPDRAIHQATCLEVIGPPIDYFNNECIECESHRPVWQEGPRLHRQWLKRTFTPICSLSGIKLDGAKVQNMRLLLDNFHESELEIELILAHYIELIPDSWLDRVNEYPFWCQIQKMLDEHAVFQAALKKMISNKSISLSRRIKLFAFMKHFVTGNEQLRQELLGEVETLILSGGAPLLELETVLWQGSQVLNPGFEFFLKLADTNPTKDPLPDNSKMAFSVFARLKNNENLDRSLQRLWLNTENIEHMNAGTAIDFIVVNRENHPRFMDAVDHYFSQSQGKPKNVIGSLFTILGILDLSTEQRQQVVNKAGEFLFKNKTIFETTKNIKNKSIIAIMEQMQEFNLPYEANRKLFVGLTAMMDFKLKEYGNWELENYVELLIKGHKTGFFSADVLDQQLFAFLNKISINKDKDIKEKVMELGQTVSLKKETLRVLLTNEGLPVYASDKELLQLKQSGYRGPNLNSAERAVLEKIINNAAITQFDKDRYIGMF